MISSTSFGSNGMINGVTALLVPSVSSGRISSVLALSVLSNALRFVVFLLNQVVLNLIIRLWFLSNWIATIIPFLVPIGIIAIGATVFSVMYTAMTPLICIQPVGFIGKLVVLLNNLGANFGTPHTVWHCDRIYAINFSFTVDVSAGVMFVFDLDISFGCVELVVVELLEFKVHALKFASALLYKTSVTFRASVKLFFSSLVVAVLNLFFAIVTFALHASTFVFNSFCLSSKTFSTFVIVSVRCLISVVV